MLKRFFSVSPTWKFEILERKLVKILEQKDLNPKKKPTFFFKILDELCSHFPLRLHAVFEKLNSFRFWVRETVNSNTITLKMSEKCSVQTKNYPN